MEDGKDEQWYHENGKHEISYDDITKNYYTVSF